MTQSENWWARLLSMVFHPMILPSLAVVILYSLPSYLAFSTTPQLRRIIVGLVFINTCVAPFLMILLMKRLGVIQSIHLSQREERIYPTLITVFFYLFTWYLFRQTSLTSVLSYFIMGAAMLVLSGFVINLYWKISFHMMAIGGFTGFLIAISLILGVSINLLIIGAIIVSGLLGSARLKLNAHDQFQVYAGWVTGIVVMLGLFMYLQG